VKNLLNRKTSDIIIYAAVAAALIQSPAAELGRTYGAGYNFMIYVAVSGMLLDIIFSAEFIIKGIKSREDNGFKNYFLRKRGWADFINSVVMLVFVSVPLMIITVMAGEDSGLLYFFLLIYGFSPAIRVLRILKFSSILGADTSGMASRHTALIADSSVIILFATAFLSQFPGYGNSAGILSIYFCAMILAVFMRIIYRGHFESTVSDIVNVINSGLRKRNYNLQVKLDERFTDDEIFSLASYYNTVFLPSKMKQILDRGRVRRGSQVKQKAGQED